MSGVIWYNINSVFEAIHADWAAYPIGNSWESAMENLSWFDPETKFYNIDDIDGAILFVGTNPAELKKKEFDPHSERYYHISLWHENLIQLHEQGFVSGVKPLTSFGYESLRFKWMTRGRGAVVDEQGVCHFPDGSTLGFPKPTTTNTDDTDVDWVCIPQGYIQLTSLGLEYLAERIDYNTVNQDIMERIKPLLSIKYYDSAVREAAILFEIKLKKINSSDLYGQKLADLHYKNLLGKFQETDSYLQYYRSLLRCSVNFIRNEYAHSFPITNEHRAKRLIGLYSKLFDLTDELQSLVRK